MVNKINKVVENSNRESMVLLKGILISFVLTLVSIFVFSIVLTYTNIQESTIFPVMVCITAISILVGSSISTIKINKNGILNGGIIGLIYVLIIYLISSIVGNGFALNMNSIILIISGIIAGMIGGIVGVNIGTSKK
ncbi:MAG: TIGR04086 family membrane protein [Clostridia bacterium]|nr:TIGR04086 family membrane protein [Clostridia bacterium]